MNKSIPSSLTIEEAVALIINLDYIPTGFSLLDMTGAFLEVAEVNYQNACNDDGFTTAQIDSLRICFDVCKERHGFAQALIKQIEYEIKNPEDSIIVISDDSTSVARLTFESLFDWAGEKFGIGIPKVFLPSQITSESNAPAEKNTPTKSNDFIEDYQWQDVTIKIYKENRIGYSIKSGKYKMSTFQEIGFFDKRKNLPNYLAGILIGLSEGKKFPVTKTLEPKDKTAISKLRKSLAKLTGLEGDPFIPFNEADGWKPRFKLIDDRRNADERAKENAKHEPFDESKHYENSYGPTSDFEEENDEADKFLRNKD
ncbi:MAG TPA: hypothetical protein PKD57_13845 [Saprospiraceae bacterium]|nr:hypothetical protein [Saprospiraceae bacterium]